MRAVHIPHYVRTCPCCNSDEHVEEVIVRDGDTEYWCSECEREAELGDLFEVDNIED